MIKNNWQMNGRTDRQMDEMTDGTENNVSNFFSKKCGCSNIKLKFL